MIMELENAFILRKCDDPDCGYCRTEQGKPTDDKDDLAGGKNL